MERYVSILSVCLSLQSSCVTNVIDYSFCQVVWMYSQSVPVSGIKLLNLFPNTNYLEVSLYNVVGAHTIERVTLSAVRCFGSAAGSRCLNIRSQMTQRRYGNLSETENKMLVNSIIILKKLARTRPPLLVIVYLFILFIF